MPDIRIVRGDALRLLLTFTDDASGALVDLTNVQLTGQVRDSTDGLVATLTVTRGSPRGVAVIQFADTSEWPVGMLRADIKAMRGGVSEHSQIFPIFLARQVTT